MKINRRQFALTMAGAALGAASRPLRAAEPAAVAGPNSQLNFALIGAGRRGRQVTQAMLQTGRARLVGLCDINEAHNRQTLQALDSPDGITLCARHEEVLSRPDVDAVVVTLPDHLHLEMAKAVLAAGKHLYLEKPSTHAFEEGPQLLQAVRASGKVCQTGTQQRSGAHYLRAKEQYFAAGKLGKVLYVRAIWNNFPWQARQVPPAPQPAGLDWDRFLGAAPKVPWDMMRYDSWRCFREYGAGVMADILNHWADVAQWMMGDDAPLNAVATGGIYGVKDGRNNPDTVSAIIQYRKGWNLEFESTVLPVKTGASVIFLGTRGTLDLSRTGFTFTPSQGPVVEVKAERDLSVAHADDFIASIETGKKPNADIDTALRGAVPCHLANKAYWSGRRVSYDADRQAITEA